MSFINTIFLFATAAAALPVLYHLVRRMRAKTVPFSSLMFLKATPKELVRKRRLKDRLLMAARVALLALLALVFARPYIPSDQLPFVPARESESVVLMIDRSFSMRHDGAFSRAVQAARDRLSTAAAGDEYSLITFDQQVQVLSQLDADPTVHQGALEAVEVGYGRTDFFPALQRAEDLLAEARHDRRVVVLISDFQEAGWTGALENWKLQEGIVFEPVAVGGEDTGNVYVEAFEMAARTGGDAEAVRFDARIAASGSAADQSRQAVLTLDGEEVERRTLPGRASAPVSFQRFLSEEGYFQGSIRLDGDELDDDNTYYFTDRMDGLPRVLVVDEPVPAVRRDAFYLRNAFDLGDASHFAFAAADELSAGSLRETDVVFISKTLNASERTALRRFVESGGAAVVSPAAASDEVALGEILASLDLGTVEQIVDAREELGYEVIIGEVESRHPIFEPFGGGGRAAILRPQFRQFARIRPAEGTTVLGRFDSGDPFMAERAVGAGRALFIASTLNTSWTDLPIDEIYVPLLYETVGYLTSASEARETYYVDETIPLDGSPEETVEVRAPGGRLFRVALDESGRGHFRDAVMPGHYAAALASGTRFFSVNVHPAESDLAQRDAEEVYASVAPPSTEAPDTPQEAAALSLEDDEKSQKLWRILLAVVLALFLVESYAANRRVRSRQSSEPPVEERRGQAGAPSKYARSKRYRNKGLRTPPSV